MDLSSLCTPLFVMLISGDLGEAHFIKDVAKVLLGKKGTGFSDSVLRLELKWLYLSDFNVDTPQLPLSLNLMKLHKFSVVLPSSSRFID